MKELLMLFGLVTSCTHVGPYVVHVKELPPKDGRAGYQLECPTTPYDCNLKAEKLCPDGHEVEQQESPKRLTIRCLPREAAARGD